MQLLFRPINAAATVEGLSETKAACAAAAQAGRLVLSALVPLLLVTGCSTRARPEGVSQVNASTGGSQAYLPKGRALRIMSLGDSITRGSGNGYGNYRRPLQSLLTKGGYAYRFVGTNTEQSQNYHGSDPEQTFSPYQPEHEGYGGFRIDQIAVDAAAKDDGGVTYPGLSDILAADKPDVVLLMLGTNDVKQGYNPGGSGYAGGSGLVADAAQRLNALIDRLYQSRADLRVVVATIPPMGDPTKNAQVKAYNALVPQIVAAHKKQGQSILLADMDAALTPGDLSADSIHPTTLGYDKMARVWSQALTGQAAPPLVSGGPTAYGPGRLDEKNIFDPTDKVAVSNAFASAAFSGSHLVDGTNKAFVFGNASNERVSLSGFHRAIGRLRFFDTPSYTGRTPAQVTIYCSAAAQTSLNPGDYTKIGTFTLPVVGDTYANPTLPAAHPDASDPACHPAAAIDFCDLDGLSIPSGTRSLLLDFSKTGGDGDGLTEIQAFAPATLKLK